MNRLIVAVGVMTMAWGMAWAGDGPCHDGYCACRSLSATEEALIHQLRHRDHDVISPSAHLTATEWALVQELRQQQRRPIPPVQLKPTEPVKPESWDDIKKRELENERKSWPNK